MNVIVEYGCGNPASIRNMLKKIGHAAEVSNDREVIAAAERLILPGVGNFDVAAERLRASNIIGALNERVLEAKVPILGICLGMQLMGRGSEEGNLLGLSWIQADCVRFDTSLMQPSDKIPHMGWADINVVKDRDPFEGVSQHSRFYFLHSYHMRCDDAGVVTATANHGHEFVAAITHGNIAGVQFHPEKSHQFGMRLLTNFMRWNPGQISL